MDAQYKIEVHLSAENLNPFGGGVALLCIQFPAQTQSDILDLQCLLAMEPIPMEVVHSVLARMLSNTAMVIPVGAAIANTIGLCEPVRIDGGPVQ
jgi:hypothetical protein